jgi:hypothetical protein
LQVGHVLVDAGQATHIQAPISTSMSFRLNLGGYSFSAIKRRPFSVTLSLSSSPEGFVLDWAKEWWVCIVELCQQSSPWVTCFGQLEV